MKKYAPFLVALSIGLWTIASHSVAAETKAMDVVNSGKSYIDKGDIDSAIEAYSEAIRIDRRSALAYSCRGYRVVG